MTEEARKARDRYNALTSALRQGVNILVQEQPSQRVSGECSPKELRTDAVIHVVHLTALAKLLIDKEVFTQEEYYTELAACAEEQVAIYEERLKKLMGGRQVTLR